MPDENARLSILKAVAVTAECLGTALSEAAARAMLADLEAFPPNAVLDALSRCRRELTGRLTLAAILDRIEDGHPAADEAFAMLPKSEYDAAMMTAEMAEAWGVARGLLDAGELTAARMAFREAYGRAVAVSRGRGVKPRWFLSAPSRGHQDARAAACDAAVREAVDRRRLTHVEAAGLLSTPPTALPGTVGEALRQLEDMGRAAGTPMPEHVREELARLKLVKGQG